jgi:thiosulfate/3-mercaptopyruvate sulfurtransferase
MREMHGVTKRENESSPSLARIRKFERKEKHYMNQSSMTNARFLRRTASRIAVYALTFVVPGSDLVFAQAGSAKSETAVVESSRSATELIQPEELARIVRSPQGSRPLIFHVGFRVLYLQAHVPNAEYIGPASEPEGVQRLRRRVRGLPRTQYIVVYCGCCPWSKCPNVNPAYRELRALGFRNVKLLYIADNFGKDWVERGYPVAKGE